MVLLYGRFPINNPMSSALSDRLRSNLTAIAGALKETRLADLAPYFSEEPRILEWLAKDKKTFQLTRPAFLELVALKKDRDFKPLADEIINEISGKYRYSKPTQPKSAEVENPANPDSCPKWFPHLFDCYQYYKVHGLPMTTTTMPGIISHLTNQGIIQTNTSKGYVEVSIQAQKELSQWAYLSPEASALRGMINEGKLRYYDKIRQIEPNSPPREHQRPKEEYHHRSYSKPTAAANTPPRSTNESPAPRAKAQTPKENPPGPPPEENHSNLTQKQSSFLSAAARVVSELLHSPDIGSAINELKASNPETFRSVFSSSNPYGKRLFELEDSKIDLTKFGHDIVGAAYDKPNCDTFVANIAVSFLVSPPSAKVPMAALAPAPSQAGNRTMAQDPEGEPPILPTS